MKSLIGDFNLDPCRVLDILLDAYQQQPRNLILARFIHSFSPRVLAQNLGFKFQQAHVSSPIYPRLCQAVSEALASLSLGVLPDARLDPSLEGIFDCRLSLDAPGSCFESSEL